MNENSVIHKNIAYHDINLYIHLCEPYQKGRKLIKRALLTYLPYFFRFNSSCQVHLLEFLSQPARKCIFIMIYQDHVTKFVILMSLTSKRPQVDTFLLRRAPSFLQRVKDRDFANNTVTSLKVFLFQH